MFRRTLLLLSLFASPVLAQEPLKSALDGNAPPFAMPTMSGETQGLTVDMTREIAKRLGRPITLQAMPFSGLIPALQARTFDMLSVPMTVTPERAEAFLLTEGIWSADYAFLLPKAAPQITDPAQLKGKTIAVNKGTVYDQWAREHAEQYGWKVDSYGSINDSAQAVQAKRADAALMGQSSALFVAKQNPAFKASDYAVASGKFYSYAFPKGSEALRDQVETVIECIKADGTAAALYAKWLGAAPAAGALEVTPQPGFGPPGMANANPAPHAAPCK